MKNVEEYLDKRGHSLADKAPTPMMCQYHPYVDTSKELEDMKDSYFHSLIVVFGLIVKFGHIDICFGVSMLSLHLALPQEGHLEQLFCSFAYLKKHTNSEMVSDPNKVDFHQKLFSRKDWFYSIYTTKGV